MSANSRFAVALHILTLLALRPGHALTSAYIAGSLNTNPVVVRRMLGALRRARLVGAEKGAHGGFVLQSTPDNISLLDIYRAVEPAEPFPMPRACPNRKCAVGARIGGILHDVFFTARSALEQELARTSLATLANQVTENPA